MVGLAVELVQPGLEVRAARPVLQWPCHGGTNQQWTVRTVDAATVSLVNRASGKCLDVPSSSTTSGTQLIQWTCSGSANQRWGRQDS